MIKSIFFHLRYWILLLVLIGLMCLAGCSRRMVPQALTVTETKDSLVIREVPVYRDTTIWLPGDTVTLLDTMFLPTLCPEATAPRRPYTKTALSNGGRTRLTVNIDSSGRLRVDCKADSIQVLLDSAVREITRIHEFYSRQKTTIHQPVPGPVVTRHRTPRFLLSLLLASLALNAWHYRQGLFSFIRKIIFR